MTTVNVFYKLNLFVLKLFKNLIIYGFIMFINRIIHWYKKREKSVVSK